MFDFDKPTDCRRAINRFQKAYNISEKNARVFLNSYFARMDLLTSEIVIQIENEANPELIENDSGFTQELRESAFLMFHKKMNQNMLRKYPKVIKEVL